MLVLGTRLNTDKTVMIALQSIFGINQSSSEKICAIAGVTPNTKFSQLSTKKLNKVTSVCREEIDTNEYRVAQKNIEFLIQMRHYKGIRHMFRLPVRGQRTRTNASTAKRRRIPKISNNQSKKK